MKCTVETSESDEARIKRLMDLYEWTTKSQVFRESLKKAESIAPPKRISMTPDELLRRRG